LRQELANLPTNEICRSAKDAMIPRLVEVARNPRRYTSHEIRNVILDAAALNRSDGLAWGLWQRTGPPAASQVSPMARSRGAGGRRNAKQRGTSMFRTIMLMPMILGFTTIAVCACLMSVARRQ
jgi:hypothetical protein